MTARTPARRDQDREQAAELLRLVARIEDDRIYDGMSTWAMASYYRHPSDLRRWAERRRDRCRRDGIELEAVAARATHIWDSLNDDLTWCAEHGLAGRLRPHYSKRWAYASIEVHDAVEVERNQSDAVRAERTAAEVARRYEANVHDRGDMVSLWPATNLHLSDGVQPALDAGLIVSARSGGLSGDTGYVPADRADAFTEALAEYEAARRRADEIHAALVDHLVARGFPGRRPNGFDTEQLRWLLAQLPAPVTS